jgi:hypothetical protein
VRFGQEVQTLPRQGRGVELVPSRPG